MIIFLYGQDTFRSKMKLRELKDKFLREIDPAGLSLSSLDGEKTTMEKINEAVSAVSLLTKKRMVVIDNIFSRKDDKLLEQLAVTLKSKKQIGGDNIIIFWDSISSQEKKMKKAKSELFKILSGLKYAQEFELLSGAKLGSWVKKEIETRGGQISQEGANALTALVGGDLWQIDNEINKLINYKAGQKLQLSGTDAGIRIEAKDVKDLVSGVFDEKIFALTDAISNRNKAAAMKLFEEQLEAGLNEEYLLTMIIRQFKILLLLRQALDAGYNSRKIASSLKLHPFVVQKGITQARNFNLVSLKNILNHLVKIDYMTKTGQNSAKTALSSLVARI